MRVVFPYIAQLHQVFHSLPLAAELATRHPHIEVRAACATDQHVDFIRRSLERHAPAANIAIDRLKGVLVKRIRRKRKRRMLLRNWRYFRSFDAIVTPERTSLFLQRIGLGATRIIWSGHGAGDRAVGFADDIHCYDYVLLGGRKLEARMLAAGLIRSGYYASGIYPKFDWLQSSPAVRFFENDRPVVLYNPHFSASLSSWPHLGHAVLQFFAARPEWNLIFAPHVRLFDKLRAEREREFESYARLPNIRVDLGSEHSIDMSYTQAADLYLGDVSSQVAEFLVRPRPCVFLNAHGVVWRDDPNYLFWHLGPVLERFEALDAALQEAFATHADYRERQQAYVADSFGSSNASPSAARGADCIVAYLEKERALRRRPMLRLARSTFQNP